MKDKYIVAQRGRPDKAIPHSNRQRFEPRFDGVSNTITTVLKDNYVLEIGDEMRIRKLTPKECFRLMGFSDEDFEKAAQVNSNSQLYKQAGNSIVVDVLEELFCMMLDESGDIFV